MLDQALLQQVRQIFAELNAQFTLAVYTDSANPHSAELKSFFSDFATTSSHLVVEQHEAPGHFEVKLLKDGADTGVVFRCIPGGHEFTSLLLAILNADGKGKNLPDETLVRRIQALRGPIHLTTYVSLTCTNCPDVVQALNIIALNHTDFTHEIVDGALFQDEVNQLHLQGVPAVFSGDKLVHSGRGELSQLLDELEENFGVEDLPAEKIERSYDLVVVGGGPAGSAAAIYSARKGLHVAIVAERLGGQVNDTVGIENLISVPKTTGPELAQHLGEHIEDYPIDLFVNRKVEQVNLDGEVKELHIKGGEVFLSKQIVIATGAGWRKLNVDGEANYLGRGVHFCPHCDGPFYKGKRVAVVGGGNSGVEAAIDLAGICSHVTVLEFADHLLADEVLQEKAKSLSNVEIFTLSQTTAVLGDGQKVTGVRVKDRTNDAEREIELDGIFVQIGLAPNTQPFAESLELSPRREIVVDATCRTSKVGVYAAGDCTTVPYKQIIVAMGEGAKAALSAFDDRVRNKV